MRRFPEPQRKLIVNSMLRRFLVDTPLAFQLLRSPEAPIHGLAIDDNRSLANRSIICRTLPRSSAALTALRSLPLPRDQENTNSEEAAARGMILEGVYMTAALQRADSTNLSDTQLIKHLERIEGQLRGPG